MKQAFEAGDQVTFEGVPFDEYLPFDMVQPEDETKQVSELNADILRLAAMAANETFKKTAEKIAQVEFENIMHRAKMEAEKGKFEMECYFIGKDQVQLRCKEMGESAPSLELIHEVLYDMFLRVGFTVMTEGPKNLFSVTIRWAKMDQE